MPTTSKPPTKPAPPLTPAEVAAVRAEAQTALVAADKMQRDLEGRGHWVAARKLAVQSAQIRQQLQNIDSATAATASSRPTAPAEDPRLERMNRVVASVLGKDRKLGTVTIKNTQYAGVPEDFIPR
jgi:hypothetical protein